MSKYTLEQIAAENTLPVKVVELDGSVYTFERLLPTGKHRGLLYCKNGNYNTRKHDLKYWNLYQEPKPTKLMAPAIVRGGKQGSCFLTDNLYSSEEGARGFLGESFVSWPAIPNKDGFYEVKG